VTRASKPFHPPGKPLFSEDFFPPFWKPCC